MSMGIIFMGDMNSASGKKALSSTTKKASNVSQNIDGVKVEGMFSKYRMKITAPYLILLLKYGFLLKILLLLTVM
jgi:hypothetical protein